LSAQPIYIELSDKLRRRLASKKINLQAGLQKQGIDAELRGLSIEGRPQARDPYLTILAVGVTVSFLGGAVARVISAIAGYKRTQMKEHDLQVALDGKGQAIVDNSGNPVYNLADKAAELPPPEVGAAKLVAGKLLSFDVSTGGAAPQPAKAIKKARSTGSRGKALTRKTSKKRKSA
jgi:hypothetical protein